MITVDCEQGTPEWIECRLGIPTASEFDKIVTSTGRLSASRFEYNAVLIAEWASGEPLSDFQGTYWTDRGSELEPQARKQYEFDADMEVKQIGFAYANEQKMYGASPDGLVGDDGLLELKCKGLKWHCYYLAHWLKDAVPRQHLIQTQAQLWVTGRVWCDLFGYLSRVPKFSHTS